MTYVICIGIYIYIYIYRYIYIYIYIYHTETQPYTKQGHKTTTPRNNITTLPPQQSKVSPFTKFGSWQMLMLPENSLIDHFEQIIHVAKDPVSWLVWRNLWLRSLWMRRLWCRWRVIHILQDWFGHFPGLLGYRLCHPCHSDIFIIDREQHLISTVRASSVALTHSVSNAHIVSGS